MRRVSVHRGLAVVAEESAPSLGRREVALLRPYLRPHLAGATGAAGLMAATIALKLAGPVFLQRAIDLGILSGDTSRLNFYGATFAVLALGSFLTLRWAMIVMGNLGERMLRDLRVGAFRHLTSLSIGFFESQRSGRLVARVTSDIEAAERMFTENFVTIVTQTLFLAGAAVVIFALDVQLALVAVAVVPVMVIVTIVFKNRSRRVYQEVRERVASVLSFLQETLRGVHVVQAFAREGARATSFAEVNEDWKESNVKVYKIESYYFPSMELLGWIGTALVIVAGGTRVADGELSLGVLAAFVVYLNSFFDPIHHLSEQYMAFQSGVAGLARVAQLLDTAPEVVDSTEAVEVDSAAGRLALRGVSFSYKPGGAAVLDNIGLEIESGSTTALVGPTGAGKSTLVKLLARFYDPADGAIELDGADLRNISQRSLRSVIALVPQEGFLFGGTIADNIRFGKPGASEQQIALVCKRLGIDGFIDSLPDGYHTEVRERGARLSAGERQLIALARAVIAEPRVILLDEATSSLDSSTEARIDLAFKAALAGRTCVLIAHRLSTAMRADRILVMERGKIVEDGSHHALCRNSGMYARLYRSWLAGDDRPDRR